MPLTVLLTTLLSFQFIIICQYFPLVLALSVFLPLPRVFALFVFSPCTHFCLQYQHLSDSQSCHAPWRHCLALSVSHSTTAHVTSPICQHFVRSSTLLSVLTSSVNLSILYQLYLSSVSALLSISLVLFHFSLSLFLSSICLWNICKKKKEIDYIYSFCHVFFSSCRTEAKGLTTALTPPPRIPQCIGWVNCPQVKLWSGSSFNRERREKVCEISCSHIISFLSSIQLVLKQW